MAVSPENDTQEQELVDIRDVHIDPTLSQEERIRSFIQQIKDPYNFKVGDVTVHVSYTENGRTLNDCFADMLSLMS